VTTPDVFTLGDDVGLAMAVEAIAHQAWADRIDPRVGMFVAEVTRHCLTPSAKVRALHDRLVPMPGGAIFPPPDADDYAIGLAAACLAAGMEVRLILAHQAGAHAAACTVLVSVRVAFSLDREQDRVDSWVVYGPEGQCPWPSPIIDSFAYVGVPGRVW
jgi:hypothetical protein